MGSEENGDSGFQQRNGQSILNCPVSEMATNSVTDKVARMGMNSKSMFKSSNEVDHFLGSEWDPIVSLNQSGNFGVTQNEFVNPYYSFIVENQTIGISCDFPHYTSDSVVVDMLPKISSKESGRFSEMVNSFGHIFESGCYSTFAENNGITIRRASKNIADSVEDRQNLKDGVLGASPSGKRKRKVSLGTISSKNFEENQQKKPSGDTSEFPNEDDEKKLKFEQNISANSDSKQNVKQAKEETIGAEHYKENCIHVRAKKGQATNSHSLAERVRRERISERMKLLQELVPGCNKITGKAVMLDEIINYVQALQHQVEFLSMKLATVNPELNADIEQIFSKDILHSRGCNSTALGIGPKLSPTHPFPGFSQGNFHGVPSPAPPFHPLPQTMWNNDQLQSMLEMGFDSNPSVSILGPNGLSKMEL